MFLIIWFEIRLLSFSPHTLIRLKIDTFSSSYTLLRTNDAGWYKFPNILHSFFSSSTLYFMICPKGIWTQLQISVLVMRGEKYLACHRLLEVGRSLGDIRKRTGNKVLIRTSCHFCPQLFCWSSQSCRSASIMGLFRVGRLCCVLISLTVGFFFFFLLFNKYFHHWGRFHTCLV